MDTNRSSASKNGKKQSPRSKPAPVFDFSNAVPKPELEDAPKGYYVRILGNGGDDVVEGKVVSVDSSRAKKSMKIQSIVDGSLIEEFHNNVAYAYRDPSRIRWYV